MSGSYVEVVTTEGVGVCVDIDEIPDLCEVLLKVYQMDLEKGKTK